MLTREEALAVVDAALVDLLQREPSVDLSWRLPHMKEAAAWASGQRLELAILAAQHGLGPTEIAALFGQAEVDDLLGLAATVGLEPMTVPPPWN